MIPNSEIDVKLEVTEDLETSKTYKLLKDKIQGYMEELESLKQAIYKVLNTEQYEHPIYSFSYGIELESLLGKDAVYVKIELKRRIQECLLQDERIVSVDNFRFTITGDELNCIFDVHSIYGEIEISKVVNI